MKRRDERAAHALGPGSGTHHGAQFWDEVEREIEALDWRDLAEFIEADEGPFEARGEFRDGLREALRRFVRRRYGQ
jgi:hypothetical protein